MRMLKINLGVIAGFWDWFISVLARIISSWPLSWRSVGALILGVVLAKWFWIFLAPQSTFTASVADPSMGHEEGRIFGVAQTAEPANQGAALPNVQLLGVFTASSGKRGFAVMKIDTKNQIGVAEGEEAAPGTKLVEVHADYVILERSGMKHRVDMVNKSADSTPAYKPAGTALTNKSPGTTQAKKPGFFLKAPPH